MIVGRRLMSQRRQVPINCRKPTEESTRLTRREKLDWAAYIAVLTIVPVGLQLWQFYATSATRVNLDVMEELSRRQSEHVIGQATGRVTSSVPTRSGVTI